MGGWEHAIAISRERTGVRHYVMTGTGNFHAKNARLYEDFGLFTADPEIGEEVANLFNTLTGYGHPKRQQKVLVAPGCHCDQDDHGRFSSLPSEATDSIASAARW